MATVTGLLQSATTVGVPSDAGPSLSKEESAQRGPKRFPSREGDQWRSFCGRLRTHRHFPRKDEGNPDAQPTRQAMRRWRDA